MQIAGLVHDSIVDGPGLRFVVFVQGCKLCCAGCHNQETWDPAGGFKMQVDGIIKNMRQNPLTDGLTLTGGEPFLQAADCASLAAVAREMGFNVWVYTGNVFEDILETAYHDPGVSEFIKHIDVLVDGRYIMEERTLSRKWRGSKNQRLIDVRKSLKEDKAVLLDL